LLLRSNPLNTNPLPAMISAADAHGSDRELISPQSEKVLHG
jgi:hypothetical protein